MKSYIPICYQIKELFSFFFFVYLFEDFFFLTNDRKSIKLCNLEKQNINQSKMAYYFYYVYQIVTSVSFCCNGMIFHMWRRDKHSFGICIKLQPTPIYKITTYPHFFSERNTLNFGKTIKKKKKNKKNSGYTISILKNSVHIYYVDNNDKTLIPQIYHADNCSVLQKWSCHSH